MSSQKLLTLTPSKEIEFPLRPYQACTQTLTLENSSDEPVAFKIKTTAPKNYLVRPSTGCIKPNSSAEIHIVLQPMQTDVPTAADRFLVQAAVSPTGEPLAKDVWADLPKDSTQENRLSVVVVRDPGPRMEGAKTLDPTLDGVGAVSTGGKPEMTFAELKAKYDHIMEYVFNLEKLKDGLERERDVLKKDLVTAKMDAGIKVGFETWQVVAIVGAVVLLLKIIGFL